MCCIYGYIVTMHIGYKTDGIPWRDGLYKHKRHPNFWLDHSLFSFYFVRQKRENPKLISCDFCVRKSEERLLAYTVLHSFKVLFVWIPVEDEAKCGVSLIRVWNVCCCENRFVRPVGRSTRRIGWKTGLESDKQGVNRTRLWSTRIKRNPKVQSYELFLWFNCNSRIFLLGFEFDFVSFLFFRCVMNGRNPTVVSEPSEFRLN